MFCQIIQTWHLWRDLAKQRKSCRIRCCDLAKQRIFSCICAVIWQNNDTMSLRSQLVSPRIILRTPVIWQNNVSSAFCVAVIWQNNVCRYAVVSDIPVVLCVVTPGTTGHIIFAHEYHSQRSHYITTQVPVVTHIRVVVCVVTTGTTGITTGYFRKGKQRYYVVAQRVRLSAHHFAQRL